MLTVEGEKLEFVLDTGSDITVITEEASRLLGSKIYPCSNILLGPNGSELETIGEIDVTIATRHRSIGVCVAIVANAKRNLLGVSQIRELGLLRSVNMICDNLFDPFKKYPELFTGLGTMPGEFKIELKEGTKPLKLFAPRTIAAGLKDKAKEELDSMLKQRVIEYVEEPTEWCSGLTIAPKANGGIRMCVDLQALNKGVKREIYPLPKVNEIIAQLAEGRYFSKLDANSGFWQVKMNKDCRKLTTFITPWGRFCFRRMPFGISSAPEFFQREMEKILKGLEGVVCMMDDVLVYGKNEHQHWDRLNKVLERIQKAGVTLRKDKCEFGRHSVKFLGHVISSEGVQSDPEKVKAICDMAPPSNRKEARRFMGMVNYLSKFGKRLSEYSIPIYAVTGQRNAWCWEDSQQDAFEKIKRELSNSPILCAFDLKKKHRLSADASKNALGAVLLQSEDGKMWQPVEYASRKMSEAEKRYAMIEKEALAITWACEKFDYYLVGRKFQIETDHKSLVPLLGSKDLSELPLRVQRFKLRLMRYDYDIFHTPGDQMYLADLLSRPNREGVEDGVIKECASIELYVDSYVRNQLVDNVRESELRDALLKDALSQECLKYIRDGEWPGNKSKMTGEMARLFSVKDSLTEYGGLILFDSRLYIPKSLREKYLQRCHEGHQGINKCRRRAQEIFWWPLVTKEIADFVRNCNVCIKSSAVKHQPMYESQLPSRPWEEVGTDVFLFKEKLYLIFCDYYSKWIEVEPLVSQTASSVVEATKRVFARLGVPQLVRSDNGPCFNCRYFISFARDWGFNHSTSSPRYPQSNGLAERAVGIVKRLWRQDDDKNAALMAYRATPLESGVSPAGLMFGRAMRSPLGLNFNDRVDYDLFECTEKARMKKIREDWNRKFRAKSLPVLKEGQKVWVKAPTDRGEEATVVRADSSPESYWVKTGNREIRRNRKHLFLLNEPVFPETEIQEPLYFLEPDNNGDSGNVSSELRANNTNVASREGNSYDRCITTANQSFPVDPTPLGSAASIPDNAVENSSPQGGFESGDSTSNDVNDQDLMSRLDNSEVEGPRLTEQSDQNSSHPVESRVDSSEVEGPRLRDESS